MGGLKCPQILFILTKKQGFGIKKKNTQNNSNQSTEKTKPNQKKQIQ